MKLHMPITRNKIKNHFHYHWWQYVLLVVLCVLGWNLLYTTTRYQTPEHLKVELYMDGFDSMETSEAMNALLQRIHAQALPEMEEVTYVVLNADDTYGPMQLTVWVSAGQGDVYLLTKDRYKSLAAGGAMVNLQPYIDSGALQVDGLNLKAGQVRDEETGEMVQRGIPTDELPNLQNYGAISKGAVLSVLARSGNEENAILFLNELIQAVR